MNRGLAVASDAVATAADGREKGTIAGDVITPFLTHDDEGLDVNSQYDWRMLEMMVSDGSVTLPEIDRPTFVSG